MFKLVICAQLKETSNKRRAPLCKRKNKRKKT